MYIVNNLFFQDDMMIKVFNYNTLEKVSIQSFMTETCARNSVILIFCILAIPIAYCLTQTVLQITFYSNLPM